jgi:hypothetical protein
MRISGCDRDKLVIVRRAKDAVEERILSLEAEVSMAHLQRGATVEQCERMVHGLTLLNIRHSEFYITITVAPPLTPLHEGMRFAAAQHTEVAAWLSALWAEVSLPTQSILGHLPIVVPHANIVGEIVVQFRE